MGGLAAQHVPPGRSLVRLPLRFAVDFAEGGPSSLVGALAPLSSRLRPEPQSRLYLRWRSRPRCSSNSSPSTRRLRVRAGYGWGVSGGASALPPGASRANRVSRSGAPKGLQQRPRRRGAAEAARDHAGGAERRLHETTAALGVTQARATAAVLVGVTQFADLLEQALAGEADAPPETPFERSLRVFEGSLAALASIDGLASAAPWAQELGIDLPCTVADVKRAFRRLAFATHPDRPGGSHGAFLRAQALLDEALASPRPETRKPGRVAQRYGVGDRSGRAAQAAQRVEAHSTYA